MYEAMAFIMLSIKVMAFCKGTSSHSWPNPNWDAFSIGEKGGFG